jgi:hypothetical protein
VIRHPQLIKHKFVTNIPSSIEPGMLYISIEYATAIHLCCCGCGEEVITPLTPTDWSLTFDGDTVSLWPSIGNWNFACRSHYVIERNIIIRAGPWSDERIRYARFQDKLAKEQYYGELLDKDEDAGYEKRLSPDLSNPED